MILFVNGQEVGRFHGARASHWLRDWVEEHLGDYLGIGNVGETSKSGPEGRELNS